MSQTTTAGPAARAGALHLLSLLRRFPGPAVVLVAVAWLGSPLLDGRVMLLVGLSAAGVGVATFAARDQVRRAARSSAAWWKLRWIRRHWRELTIACGLTFERPRARDAGSLATVESPTLRSARARWPRVALTVRPLLGQTLADYEDAGERLRMAVGATQLRVEPSGSNEITLTFTVGDGLTRSFAFKPAPLRDNLREVRIGQLDDGTDWYLPIGPHTLVAGCSGSGKGSLFWSFAFGLGPAVRDGRVQLHGIDLKGGMEVLMGKEIFTSHATSAAEAVVVLERLVDSMRERTRRYAGRVRSHAASLTEPLHVVMIDELAALTAYCPERELQRRAEMAINLLCSQGRAPGFVVFACLQDPRKEVIPSRGLFTQMIGLRLKDYSETAMVLGDQALTGGALCHRISRATPGMGYVVPEDGGAPVRVRAGFVSDDVIRELSSAFAAPTHLPVIVPAFEENSRRVRRAGQGGEVG